jgi:uncharacterized protein YheU (UPF0270 family)
MLIQGKCHCGNIVFSLTWEPDPVEIPARACTCSFCTKHGGVWTSNPTGVLEVVVNDPTLVSKHEFGTQTAHFHVCARCGVVPVVTSQIDDKLYAVVNVNAFEGVDSSLLRRASMRLDDEEKESRLARRKRNWISRVTCMRRIRSRGMNDDIAEKTALQIPVSRLSRDAIDGLIEEFVTRDGTDYGEREQTMEEKKRAVARQLERGEVVIVFDPESETCNIISKDAG